ncbi:unnamed protein product [Moneuplotes crassus]|uniref:Uncharacterized protein n=1 Tax=Euplotes crassus TaxID=5936 RepID=A0AAD1Y6C9_EUPCR|nr:unnamed protein product [Moneuplotes crassus]
MWMEEALLIAISIPRSRRSRSSTTSFCTCTRLFSTFTSSLWSCLDSPCCIRLTCSSSTALFADRVCSLAHYCCLICYCHFHVRCFACLCRFAHFRSPTFHHN